MKITRVNKKTCLVLVASTLFTISCASAPKEPSSPNTPVAATEEEKGTESAKQEATKTSNKNEFTESKTPAQADAGTEYSKKVADVKIEVTASPAAPVKNNAFKTPFTVKATKNDGTPCANLELTVSYPLSRKGDEITFAEESITTNADGIATFLPNPPTSSFNSEIKFFPAGDTKNESIAKLAAEHTATAKYQVVTNLKTAGGLISVVEYNEKGIASMDVSRTSSKFLMALMRAGFKGIGNAPLESAIVTNDQNKIYEKAKSLNAPRVNFVIYGTAKYGGEGKISKVDDGYSCTLVGDITCINLKDGSILYHKVHETTIVTKNSWNALETCRETLATEIVSDMQYSM